jgi:peptide/nickel transport system permease protein
MRSRLAANPRPALRWTAVALAVLLVEFGAFLGGLLVVVDSLWLTVTAILDLLVSTVWVGGAQGVVDVQQTVLGFIDAAQEFARSIPTLLNRDVIPNEGHMTGPNGPWEGTFLGLEPALAWALRVLLIFAYAFFTAYWVFKGWLVFREHYRASDWTPRDDMVDRLRGHRWAEFGIVVVLIFVTMALFAPALGPTTIDKNVLSTYSHEIQYFDQDSGQVETIPVGDANFGSKSKGAGDNNVAPMTYDDYNRFHPFGTITNGRDLFTILMAGARVSLVVASIAIGLNALIATLLALVSAYYGGSIDLFILTMADGFVAVPILLLLLLVSTMFTEHWIAQIMDGGFLIGLAYGVVAWPFLWRAIRGPAFQVAGQEWVDAAKSYGQLPLSIMRKHMFPYVAGYMMIFASLSFGGIIILLASLSFLNVGIEPPTPSWGRMVNLGQDYVAGPSWHISAIPGVLIVIVVTGMNALGDGLRDAIDPESEGGGDEAGAAGGGA